MGQNLRNHAPIYLPRQPSATRGKGGDSDFLGHPRGLSFLFATEMWERFSYYGMRALLVLYMTKYLLLNDRAENVAGLAGYIESHADVYAALRLTDVLVYAFADGLSSRRGSVLAALLSGRPVVVNAPQNACEFDHHPAFRQALAAKALRLVETAEDVCAYADAIEQAHGARQATAVNFDQCWRDAAAAFGRVLREEPKYSPAGVGVPAE